jgi:hypothetical protein
LELLINMEISKKLKYFLKRELLDEPGNKELSP